MLANIFTHINTSNMESVILWLLMTYAAVIVCMIIDLILGVQKAKANHIARTSKGFKMTCAKAEKYFVPMICLTAIDFLASAFIEFPPFTMLMGAFNCFCEFKSIMESTHQKAEIHDAANTMSVILKNKEDIANVLVELLNSMDKDNKKAKSTKTVKRG